MGKKSLIELGQDLNDSLIDFCEAHYGAPQSSVIRSALEFFIEEKLNSEPETRKRYEAAREKRIGCDVKNVRVLNQKSNKISR